MLGRSYWILWCGQVVSALGDGFGNIALSWLVYDLTRSMLAMGTLFSVGLLPQLLLWLVGAPLVDRVNRRRLMAALDVIRCGIYAIPPVLAATGQLSLWHLYALNLAAAAAGALYQPASMALLPSLVDNGQLVKANAISDGAYRATSLAGPLLAGLVVAGWGSHPALLLDSVSFALAALSLRLLPATVGVVSGKGMARPRYVSEAMEGFRFFGRVPALLIVVVLSAFYNLGVSVITPLYVPFIRDQVGGSAKVLGLSYSLSAFGFVVGSAILGGLGELRQRRLLVTGALSLSGLLMALFAVVGRGQAAFAVGIDALLGVLHPFFYTLVSYLFQRLVPDRLRGRASAVRLLIARSLTPLGAFLGALAAERIGLQSTFLLAGLPVAILAGVSCLIPALRGIDGDLRPVDPGELGEQPA